MRNQIVILAAGKGTRMGQSNVPKVLVMLKNKPLILYLLEQLEKINQLAKPIVVVGYKYQEVRDVLGENYIYAIQQEQLGTGDAVKAALTKVKAENILVLYGDMPFIKAESLKELIKLHFKKHSVVSMFTVKVNNFIGINKTFDESFGRVIRDSHKKIVKVIEYKDASLGQKKIMELNPGIYMFNTNWLKENITKINNHNAQHEYYLTDMIEIAISQKQNIASLPIDSKEVLGINSKEDLKLVETLQ